MEEMPVSTGEALDEAACETLGDWNQGCCQPKAQLGPWFCRVPLSDPVSPGISESH